jgi:hypothetical protein
MAEPGSYVAAILQTRVGSDLPRILLKGSPRPELEGAFEALVKETAKRMATVMDDMEIYRERLISSSIL